LICLILTEKWSDEGEKEKGKNERGPSGGWSRINHDRAKSPVRHQGNWQAPIRDLADQGASGAGVRAAAPHLQEDRQHARGRTETAAGLTHGIQATLLTPASHRNIPKSS